MLFFVPTLVVATDFDWKQSRVFSMLAGQDHWALPGKLLPLAQKTLECQKQPEPVKVWGMRPHWGGAVLAGHSHWNWNWTQRYWMALREILMPPGPTLAKPLGTNLPGDAIRAGHLSYQSCLSRRNRPLFLAREWE